MHHSGKYNVHFLEVENVWGFPVAHMLGICFSNAIIMVFFLLCMTSISLVSYWLGSKFKPVASLMSVRRYRLLRNSLFFGGFVGADTWKVLVRLVIFASAKLLLEILQSLIVPLYMFESSEYNSAPSYNTTCIKFIYVRMSIIMLFCSK